MKKYIIVLLLILFPSVSHAKIIRTLHIADGELISVTPWSGIDRLWVNVKINEEQTLVFSVEERDLQCKIINALVTVQRITVAEDNGDYLYDFYYVSKYSPPRTNRRKTPKK